MHSIIFKNPISLLLEVHLSVLKQIIKEIINLTLPLTHLIPINLVQITKQSQQKTVHHILNDQP